ncbi:dolichyl-phosphate-mannose-protein mannosyltransferase 2 [Zalerion maritima]|uniref:Dolichyl-phosphate-mannose-protein mannosyltransferase 2 n=1 Tax=Zalerion maritima TaxID=339359 RepID=A0AAD5RKF0_9PEZI|nr:dolichyl-phosphate-mannose-protein mannosyltransferase 2 [Zalerion maritima]
MVKRLLDNRKKKIIVQVDAIAEQTGQILLRLANWETLLCMSPQAYMDENFTAVSHLYALSDVFREMPLLKEEGMGGWNNQNICSRAHGWHHHATVTATRPDELHMPSKTKLGTMAASWGVTSDEPRGH